MIRHLLVPTDFSEPANNSLRYAIDLMPLLQASKLVVLHAYHIPVSTIETAYMADQALMLEQAEQMAQIEMDRLEKNLLRPSGVPYECINHIGPAMDEINQVVKDKQIDLVIMASHKVSRLERIFGSLTMHAMEHCKVPVLVVPDGCSFQPMRHIVYATDLQKIPYDRILMPLRYLARLFGGKITLFNVNRDYNHLKEAQARVLTELTTALQEERVHLAFSDQKGREDAILHFVQEEKADLLVVVPHQHGFFDELFRSSLSKKLALHSRVPLLAIRA